MGIFRLKKSPKALAVSGIDGRAYFRKAAQEMQIAGLDPVAIQNLEPLPSQPGPRKSRVGGRIAWDLKYLSEQDARERAERSERFLKQKPVVVAAEQKPRHITT